MNLTVSNNVTSDNGFVMSALNSGTSLSATGGFGVSLVDGSSSLSTFSLTSNTITRNGTLSMLMGGVTSTPGSNLIGELTNAASVACFNISGNSFDADYMLDNQAGGLFQVIDLNNLDTNNTGAMPTFAPGIMSFTDTPSH